MINSIIIILLFYSVGHFYLSVVSGTGPYINVSALFKDNS